MFICHNGFMCNSMYNKGELPGAPLINFNDERGRMGGWSERGLYFIPKEITTSEFVCQFKSLLFWHTPKNPLAFFSQPQKIPLFFLRPKKIPTSFIDPKKSLLAKISDSIKSFDPSPPRH